MSDEPVVEVLVVPRWASRRLDTVAVALELSRDEILAGIVNHAFHQYEARVIAVSQRDPVGAWQAGAAEWWTEHGGGVVV